MLVTANTAHFIVTYDDTFINQGIPAPAIAQALVDSCEYDLTRMSKMFGGLMLPANFFPITIAAVTTRSGGWNQGQIPGWRIECGVTSTSDPGTVIAIHIAELAEVFMVAQNKGWNPGVSSGEALSKFMGGVLYPDHAFGFMASDRWLNSKNPVRYDWVSNVEQTDINYVSSGCGTLFLNYLAYQLNFPIPDIIAAGAPNTNTLKETASLLGVQGNIFQDFANLLQAHFPANVPFNYQNYTSVWSKGDEQFPLGPVAQVPALYLRHNLADDGTSHTGSLSNSPDIIVKNNSVADPQTTYSTLASIGNDMESDANVLTKQDNFVYVRGWNRGPKAVNVFATVYWTLPSTLPTPDKWNLLGTAYFRELPNAVGMSLDAAVRIPDPGITWPADKIPQPDHYCFVATIGTPAAPAPTPTSFADFNAFVNYIYANNNITWRNFNVVDAPMGQIKHFPGFIPLPFNIVGAWDRARKFALETIAELPHGSRLALQVPEWIGRGFEAPHADMEALHDEKTDPKHPRRTRLLLQASKPHHLGLVQLHSETNAASHLLVHIPDEHRRKPHRIVIRQLYEGREVGRITWAIVDHQRRHAKAS